MNRSTKMTIILLSVFVLGIVMTAIAAEPVEAKKFKDNGYEWEINDTDWEKMIKVANDEYRSAENQGRAIPIGYSYQKNITVTKDGIQYDGIAIKNHKSVRCEVRGVGPEYLTQYETVAAP